MFDKKQLKYLQPLWVLVIFVLAACAGEPSPTPVPPTPTPLPMPTPAESDNEGESEVGTENENESDTSAATGLRTFQIVPEESQASYIVDEEFFESALDKYGIDVGRVDTVGTTQEIEGQLQINLADLSDPLGTNRFTVNLASLTSDQSLRDRWLRDRGPQFSEFPTAEFVATGIEAAPNSYTEGEQVQFKMLGDLTIREVTQPATFDVTATQEGDTVTGVATADLRMTDFGIEPPNFANTLTVADEFTVRVEFTAREQ